MIPRSEMEQLTIELRYLIGAIRKLRRSLVFSALGFSFAVVVVCVITLYR